MATAGVSYYKNTDPQEFNTPKPLSELSVDFSIPAQPRVWGEVARDIALILMKIVIFPLALYELAKFIVQRLVMMPLYPAQSRIMTHIVIPYLLRIEALKTQELDNSRKIVADWLREKGFVVRHLVLEDKGVRYSGFMVGHQDTIANGKWALQADGNAAYYEHSAIGFAEKYSEVGFNILMVNGPAVGRSQGHAVPASMGDAQEVGLRFIEEALKANQVVIAGRSLGGAAIGEMLLKHTFRQDVKYLVIRQMTFDRVSNICAQIVGKPFPWLKWPVAEIARWSGCEMDLVASSQHLQKLNIKEIIIQRANPQDAFPTIDDFQDDGTIHPKASLGRALVKEGVIVDKVFRCLPHARHMTYDIASDEIQEHFS